MALYALPFVREIKTALTWMFKKTTMSYDDCVKLG